MSIIRFKNWRKQMHRKKSDNDVIVAVLKVSYLG